MSILIIFSFSCPTQCELKLTRRRGFLTCGVKGKDEGGRMTDERIAHPKPTALSLPIVRMRLPRFLGCYRKAKFHPSSFRLHPLSPSG